MKINVILTLLALSLMACVESEDVEQQSGTSTQSTEQNLDDERADRIVRWRVRHSDTTFWFESEFEIENRSAPNLTGKVGGRTSRNIVKVRSRFSTGEPLLAEIISPRKFELKLDEEQIIKAATGDAILTTVETSLGERHVFTRFAPRLKTFEGDHRIYVLRSMNAVYVGDELTFRGRVNTASGWELLHVRSSSEDGEIVSEPNIDLFDFKAKSMANILGADSGLSFTAHDGGRQYLTKNAKFGLRLSKLAAADLPPSQVWPNESCHPEVHACLRNYKGTDFENCGYANQVTACWAPHAVDFSKRLKEEISQFYAKNPRQIRAQEGRSKNTALARISPNKVGYVDPLEDEDHDLRNQENDIVVYHPGVIFRRSSVLWQGHYNQKGDFQYIEKIN